MKGTVWMVRVTYRDNIGGFRNGIVMLKTSVRGYCATDGELASILTASWQSGACSKDCCAIMD